MIIYIQEECLSFDNDLQKVQSCFDQIEDILKKKDLKLSHLIIDDHPIYEDYYNYFIQNIENINRVIVVIQNIETLVNNTIVSTFNYLNNGIPIVKSLSEEFYQLPGKVTWENLNDFFEGMQWIIETVAKIEPIKNLDKILAHYETWNEYVQLVSELNEIIPQFEDAMVNRDNILIGDLLLYEIIPVFEKMTEKLMFLLPSEVDYIVG